MWSVGDKCMAPFSEDDQYYRATIQSITNDCQGNQRVEVKFSGYTSDENETVDATRIKERVVRKRQQSGSVRSISTASASSGTNTSFTSPLNYIPENDRLRDKFSDLLDDENDFKLISTTLKSSGGSASTGTKSSQRRKYAVAIGGEAKDTSPVFSEARNSSKSPSISNQAATSISDNRSYLDEFPSLDDNEGFSSAELERPYFPESSHVGPKVPFLLSEPDTEPIVQVPATINRYLRDYQREGVRFLYQHFIKNQGAILGDDMGLGKTVQVLAFLCAVLGKTGTKEDCQRRLPEFLQKKSHNKKSKSTDVYLIISPNAVLYNWLDEFETWTYCTTGKYHGKDRGETLLKATRGKLDVVLTTYETFRIYLDELCTVKWKAVIVDEVHKIKSPAALITEALKTIPTKRRYGLTGTALQNDMSELWCVLDWANPGCLGSLKEFKFNFMSDINKGQKFDASKRELAEGRQTSLRFSRLRNKWLLRRTKGIIAKQLPTKEEKVVFCKLTALQLSVYKALVDSDDLQQFVLRQYEQCDCGSGYKRGQCCYHVKVINGKEIKVKSLTFSFMHLLMKVSNHVALLMPETKMSDLQRYSVQTYCDIAFAKHPQFVKLSRESRFCTLSDPKYCGKMQVLERLLQVFRKENSKVLIFSHYTQLLDIFEMYLKTTDYVYRRLDGKTPAQDRLKYTHEFNRDKDIFLFLISTKAGGIGLNLTGANVVIIYDPTWNPTYDLQAQDRAYRIGQHRDVRVYRLISAGSIEENMYLRQIYKQQIASVAIESENAKRFFTGVAGSRDKSGELFGLRNMFALRAGDCVLTKDVIERESKTIAGITMAKYISNQKPPSDEDNDGNKANQDSIPDDSDEEENPISIESGNEDEDDIYGIASQLMLSGESDNDDETRLKQDRKSQCDRSSPAVVNRKTNIADAEQTDDKSGLDESSLEETGARMVKGKRGKALLHRDGRIERRGKGLSRTGHTDGLKDGGSSDEEAMVERKQGGSRNKSSKMDTVDDVLNDCGISYVHSNQRLVGGSKIEDHVSNAALRDVFELDQHSQEPANYNVPTLEHDTESQNSSNSKDNGALSVYLHNLPTSQSKPLSDKIDKTTILIGQTPNGIRKRHFAELAKYKGLSIKELAKHLLQASLEDQVNMLKDFYTERHTGLELSTFFEIKDEPEPESRPQASGRGRHSRNPVPESKPQTSGRGRPKQTRPKQTKSKEESVSRKFGQRATRTKMTKMEKKTRRVLEKRKSKPRGYNFESDSDDSDEMEEERSRIQQGESSRIQQSGRSRIQQSESSRSQKHKSRTKHNDDNDTNIDSSLIRDQEERVSDKTSDVEEMDTNDSDTAAEVDLEEEFTNLKGQWSHAQKANSSPDKKQDSDTEINPVHIEKPITSDGNLSFLDDIFLDKSSTKKVRKPPPKKSSKTSTQKLQTEVDTLWGDDFHDSTEKNNSKPPPKTKGHPCTSQIQKHPADGLSEDHVKDPTEFDTSTSESETIRNLHKSPLKRKFPYGTSTRTSHKMDPILDGDEDDIDSDFFTLKHRKPPPKRSQYKSSKRLPKDIVLDDITEDNLSLTDSATDSQNPPRTSHRSSPGKCPKRENVLADFSEEDQTLTDSIKDSLETETDLEIEPGSKLWRRNSKHGFKLDEFDASLEEESQSVFNKYSSSFVTNKNYKRKLYQFDAEKGEILSQELSSA